MWDKFDLGRESKNALLQAHALSSALNDVLAQASIGINVLPKAERKQFEGALKTAQLLSQYLDQAIAGDKSIEWFTSEAISLKGQLARISMRLPEFNNGSENESKLHFTGESGKDVAVIKNELNQIGVEDGVHTRLYLSMAQQILDEIESFTQFSHSGYSKSKIVRKIKPKDEHKQVVLSILNYFGRIIQNKHGDMNVKVTTEQSEAEIVFLIEMDKGDKSEVEDTLYQYGLVVVDDDKPENLLPVSSQAMELKHKLEIAKMELRHTTELLHSEREGYGSKICSMEDEIKWLRESLSEGINRVSHLQDVVSNIAVDSSETLKEALKIVIRKTTDGIDESDKEKIMEELEKINREDPGMLDKLNKIAVDVFSGTSSGLLSSWIAAVLTSMPK